MFMYLSFQIKDQFRFMCPVLLCRSIVLPAIQQFNQFSRFIKTYIKKYYDFQVHFYTLTFSFFIAFILNYAIFNLQLLVS